MTRWIFRILLCLLLGVVTTVGVAWGLAIAVSLDTEAANVEVVSWSDDSIPWPIQGITDDTIFSYRSHYRSVGAYRIVRANSTYLEMVVTSGVSRVELRAMCPDWAVVECPDWAVGVEISGDDEVVIDARGFPMLALVGVVEIDASVISAFWRNTSSGRGRQPRLASIVRPVRPVWSGLLINTLFYTAIWFVLLFGWRAHRRVIRRWQGYCPLCTYDLRGDLSTGCPECGWGREGAPGGGILRGQPNKAALATVVSSRLNLPELSVIWGCI